MTEIAEKIAQIIGVQHDFTLSIEDSDKYFVSFCNQLTSCIGKFTELGIQVKNFTCEDENHEFKDIQHSVVLYLQKYIEFYTEVVVLLQALANNKENFNNQTLFGKLIEIMANGGEILVHPMASFQGVEKSVRETFFNRFNLKQAILGSYLRGNEIEEK